MTDTTVLLLESLLEKVPSDLQEKINADSETKAGGIKFLKNLLDEEGDPEVLLSASVRPSQDSTAASKSIVERIAELDSQQHSVDRSIRNEVYENLNLVLNGSEAYKECDGQFTSEMVDLCDQMLVDNQGQSDEAEGENSDGKDTKSEDNGNENGTTTSGAVQPADTETWKSILRQHRRQDQRIWHKKGLKGDQTGRDASDGQTGAQGGIAAEKSSSAILYDMDRIMDILELPTLASACVQSGHYGECVEIASYVRQLATWYSGVSLIVCVEKELKREIHTMIVSLVRLLNTDLKQSHIVKIITYLRRIAPFQQKNDTEGANSEFSQMDDEILERILLKSRYQFIIGELEVLKPLCKTNTREKYLKRCIEVLREHCFLNILTFQSIFGTPEGAAGKKMHLLVYSFVKALILQLCRIFKQQIPLLPDQSSTDGLFFQLVYCCQSVGRVGGDFTPIILTQLDEFIDKRRWCRILRKQQVMARTMSR